MAISNILESAGTTTDNQNDNKTRQFIIMYYSGKKVNKKNYCKYSLTDLQVLNV